MRKLILSIASLLCFGVALTGVIIYTNLSNYKLEDHTTIKFDEDTNKTYNVKLEDLFPGGSHTYEIILDSESSDYYVELSFSNFTTSTLTDYLSVDINYNDNTLSKTFSNLVTSNETLSLGNNIQKIDLTYRLSLDAPNETQGANIDFNLNFTIRGTSYTNN